MIFSCYILPTFYYLFIFAISLLCASDVHYFSSNWCSHWFLQNSNLRTLVLSLIVLFYEYYKSGQDKQNRLGHIEQGMESDVIIALFLSDIQQLHVNIIHLNKLGIKLLLQIWRSQNISWYFKVEPFHRNTKMVFYTPP